MPQKTAPRNWEWLADRFEVDAETECWNWTSTLNAQGYGVCGAGGRGTGNMLAHRFAYSMFYGDVPAHIILHHECENPRCVNPDHLRTTTRAEHARLHHRGVTH